MVRDLVLIIDFDGEYALPVSRSVREMHVYCEVVRRDVSAREILDRKPKGVIVAGNCGDDNENGACVELNERLAETGLPLHWVHGTEDVEALRAFLFSDCGCAGDWRMDRFTSEMIAELRENVGGKKVLCALSGGVDSSVSAALLHKAIGQSLICVFVDHGLMRLNEPQEVKDIFSGMFGANLIMIDARQRFLDRLAGVTDPEEKRKIIGAEFIKVFEEEAKKIGTVDYLVQGTIYPDIIESGTQNAALVKSHHNVGGLPDVIDFKEIIEPLRDLFKDEVRKVGLELGLPEKLVYRQPFPGPGLGVRVIGEITEEKLEILRQADFIFRDEIKKAGLERSIWQFFAVITGISTVGVKGGRRAYGHTIALRAVNSIDAMTADWARIPYDTLEAVSERIVTEILAVNRVVYDITRKPPGTIEWE